MLTGSSTRRAQGQTHDLYIHFGLAAVRIVAYGEKHGFSFQKVLATSPRTARIVGFPACRAIQLIKANCQRTRMDHYAQRQPSRVGRAPRSAC
jgi:hypothetical protein